MSIIARARTVVGSLCALMRNRLGLNVATSLEAQEISCVVAPDRRLVVLGHEPIAGFSRDHGTVADEAAMLAMHTLDSTTLLAEPRFVAPGDSCLRADDPNWRWHCIAGHGTTLSDWERRPLGGALSGVNDAVAELAAGLAGKVDSAELAAYAPLASPALTGAPTAPTPAAGDTSTRIATAAFVAASIAGASGRGLFSGQLAIAVPRVADWSAGWVNQGTATATDLPEGCALNLSGQTASSVRMLVRPAPAAPCRITAAWWIESDASTSSRVFQASLGWRRADGYLHYIAQGDQASLGTASPRIVVKGRTAADGGTSTDLATMDSFGRGLLWVRATITASVVRWEYSRSGRWWYVLHETTPAAAYLGASGYAHQVIWGANAVNGASGLFRLLSLDIEAL